jgi:two-component sensor histidine kinase
VHEQLYKSAELSHIDIGEYIETLARLVMKAHQVGPSAVRLDIDVEDIPLEIDLLIPCGIMLNELLTNAVKYGIHGRQDAVISVSLKQDESPSDYIVVVRDNGPGLPVGFSLENSDTLGVQIVEALVGQLQGDIKWENDNGAKFTIRFSKTIDED